MIASLNLFLDVKLLLSVVFFLNLDILISPDIALRPKSLLFYKVGPNENYSSLQTLTVEEYLDCWGYNNIFTFGYNNLSSGVAIELLLFD